MVGVAVGPRCPIDADLWWGLSGRLVTDRCGEADAGDGLVDRSVGESAPVGLDPGVDHRTRGAERPEP